MGDGSLKGGLCGVCFEERYNYVLYKYVSKILKMSPFLCSVSLCDNNQAISILYCMNFTVPKHLFFLATCFFIYSSVRIFRKSLEMKLDPLLLSVFVGNPNLSILSLIKHHATIVPATIAGETTCLSLKYLSLISMMNWFPDSVTGSFRKISIEL